MKSGERILESLMLGSRWLLVPLYAVLCLILAVFAVKAVQELWHLVLGVLGASDIDLVLATLSLIDLALVGNLLVMVALSGYETFVSRFDTVGAMEKPLWLGKLDPGTVKVKVAASIVAISAIQLLKMYMTVDAFDERRVIVMTAVHVVFVLSAIGLAFIDRMAFAHHRAE